MSVLCRVLFLGAVLFCPLCGSATAVSPDEPHVPPIWKGKANPLKVYQQVSTIRGPLIKSKLVIREEAAWKDFAAKYPELANVKVDFSKQMVLVVAEEPRGRGKYLSHVTVTETLACIPQVSVVLHYGTLPPGVPVLQDIIWPNHVIVVDKSAAPVNFSEVVHNDWMHIKPFPKPLPLPKPFPTPGNPPLTAEFADLLPQLQGLNQAGASFPQAVPFSHEVR